MALNLDDIKRIAMLARIEVSESEAQETLHKLSGILGLIEQMQAVDTTGITPMSHSQDVTQRLREDVVTKPISANCFNPLRPQHKTVCILSLKSLNNTPFLHG